MIIASPLESNDGDSDDDGADDDDDDDDGADSRIALNCAWDCCRVSGIFFLSIEL